MKKIQQIVLSDALKISSEALIDVEELKKYFCGYDSVGCYIVQENLIFDEPIKLSELREHFVFFPPQSFVALSDGSSNWIDKKSAEHPLRRSSSIQVDGTLRSGADESKI